MGWRRGYKGEKKRKEKKGRKEVGDWW